MRVAEKRGVLAVSHLLICHRSRQERDVRAQNKDTATKCLQTFITVDDYGNIYSLQNEVERERKREIERGIGREIERDR